MLIESDINEFKKRLMGICVLLGDSELECDDPGDRWINVTYGDGTIMRAELRDNFNNWTIQLYEGSGYGRRFEEFTVKKVK